MALPYPLLSAFFVATQAGVVYTIADFITFQGIPSQLSGNIYINTLV